MKFEIMRTSGGNINYPEAKKERVLRQHYTFERSKEYFERNTEWIKNHQIFRLKGQPITSAEIWYDYNKLCIKQNYSRSPHLLEEMPDGSLKQYEYKYMIEINTLKDLLRLIENVGEVVVDKEYIEIYDDYRE